MPINTSSELMDAMDRSPQLAGQPGLAHQPSTFDQFHPLEKLVDLPRAPLFHISLLQLSH